MAKDVMTEAELQAWVLETAQLHGWLCHHAYVSYTAPRGRKGQLRTNPGFPDLVLAKGDRLIFAELKTQKGRIRPEQKVWLEELNGVVWRPSDMEQIEGILVGTPNGHQES